MRFCEIEKTKTEPGISRCRFRHDPHENIPVLLSNAVIISVR